MITRQTLLSILLALAALSPAFAQTAADTAKVRKEWAMTDAERAEQRKRAHALEQNWSRGLWVVRNPLFFSSYKNVDDYLSEEKFLAVRRSPPSTRRRPRICLRQVRKSAQP
jgi:hypothetical protein